MHVNPGDGTISGTVSDGGQLADLSIIVRAPSGESTTQPLSKELVLSTSVFNYNLEPTETGTYQLWVRAIDDAGNVTQLGPYEVMLTSAQIKVYSAIELLAIKMMALPQPQNLFWSDKSRCCHEPISKPFPEYPAIKNLFCYTMGRVKECSIDSQSSCFVARYERERYPQDDLLQSTIRRASPLQIMIQLSLCGHL